MTGESRVSTDSADRVAYARDLWPRHQLLTRLGTAAPFPPAVVVWPESIEEVAAVVRYAREHTIPLVPYGAGSGVCGGVKPTGHAIVMDMKRMRRITRVDSDSLTVTAEAGILGQHLEDGLAQRGFTLGHFPSSIACSTLGGWVAARSAGQCSGRYGKIEDMLTAVTFVDGRGEVHRGEVGAPSEWLIPFVTGSEGILGIVTESTLRISPVPQARVFWSATFDSTEKGLQAIRDIYQAGLRPAVARLYDAFDTFIGGKAKDKETKDKPRKTNSPGPGDMRPGLGIRALVSAVGKPGALNALVHAVPESMLAGALLVLMWEDDESIASAELARAQDIARRYGGKDTGETPARKWFAHRHSVSYRQSPIFAGGGFADTMEVAAPWSRLWEVHEAVRAAVKPYVFVMAHFSHAYPDGGSIYFTFAGSAPSDEEALARYDATWKAALAATIRAGGVISHHHGVGFSKAPFMREDQGLAVDLTAAAKRVLDPAGVLNPGALLPPEEVNSAKVAPPSAAPPVESQHIDHASQSVFARADQPLRAVETALRAEDLTLGMGELPADITVADWLRSGLPRHRDTESDPVDQTLSGIGFRVAGSTQSVRIRPAPRRAAGPDWIRVFASGGGALGTLEGAWLTATRATETTARAFLFGDATAARRARAWMRGRGVRPLRTHVMDRSEGTVLGALFDGDAGVRAAAVSVFDAVCVELGGVIVTAELAHEAPLPARAEGPVLLSDIAREFAKFT